MRDLPRLHICLMVLRHALRPRMCLSSHAHCRMLRYCWTVIRDRQPLQYRLRGSIASPLRIAAQQPPLITLDPCRHLQEPKPRYGCGGSPLTRRDSNPLSNVHLVAHRIFVDILYKGFEMAQGASLTTSRQRRLRGISIERMTGFCLSQTQLRSQNF